MSNDNDNRIHEHINIECRTNDTLTELELLQEAKNTSHSTLCEMESEYAKYLAKYRNSQTEAMLSQELTLHKISLTQPLKYASQAELPALAAKTKELDDEMPNILEALSILYDLLIKTKKGTVDNDLVALIAEKIDHNKLRAEMFPQCKEKRVSYSYDPLTYLNLVPHPFEALLLQEAMMVMRIVNQTYFTIWQRHSKHNANVTCDI